MEPVRVTRTIPLKGESDCALTAAAGDGKINNSTSKRHFGMRTRMLVPEEMEELTGYCVGGICPFDGLKGAKAYLGESLRRFQTTFPACGTPNSTIELTCDELLECSRAQGWVDTCEGWREQSAGG